MFDFETNVGRGAGVVRLVCDEGTWKEYMMYTALQELKGFEESVGVRRVHGGSNSLIGGTGWKRGMGKGSFLATSLPCW
jgi:hypothetical protein